MDPAHGQFDKVPLVFGSLQTFNEADPAWVRVRKIEHGHVMKVCFLFPGGVAQPNQCSPTHTWLSIEPRRQRERHHIT
jgi:hypothetical protein